MTLGVISWLELPPPVWFGLAFAAAVPLVFTSGIRRRAGGAPVTPAMRRAVLDLC